ncbi:MAG: SPOR domain-containing protein [Bacteroidales bacterium]|nr:SPOR domain-containing protein [Bacteroidales bacterium]
MKIAKHVGDLLYDYECVVIPGLGGFLTQEKPSSINPVTHQFRPPYKQISFNAFLKTNDGLLINYVARQEGMDYKIAKDHVDQFVLQCDRALKAGKKINFHSVGYLYLNDNDQVVFSQDTGVNYNSEAFGLNSFVSPAISRSSAEERIHEKVIAKVDKTLNKKSTDRKTKVEESKPESEEHRVRSNKNIASDRKSPYRQQTIFLALLIMAMIVGWGFMNKDKVQRYYNNYSSVIPLFSLTPNAYLIDNAHKISIFNPNSKSGLLIMKLFSGENQPVTKTEKVKILPVQPSQNTVTNKATDNTVSSTSVNPNEPAITKNIEKPSVEQVAKTVSNPVPSVQKEQPVVASPRKHFYIIAGAFKNRTNADDLIRKLRLKGFQAVQAGTTLSGLHRVAFGDFENKLKAQNQLVAIRKNENPSAWIFEQ